MPSLRPILATLCAVFMVAPALAIAGEDATPRLAALLEREWQRDLADNPLVASYRGDTRYDELWPDISTEAQQARDAADAMEIGRAHV